MNMLTVASGKCKQKNFTVIHGRIIPAAGMKITEVHGLWYVVALLSLGYLFVP